jgi:hypothetical protein
VMERLALLRNLLAGYVDNPASQWHDLDSQF